MPLLLPKLFCVRRTWLGQPCRVSSPCLFCAAGNRVPCTSCSRSYVAPSMGPRGISSSSHESAGYAVYAHLSETSSTAALKVCSQSSPATAGRTVPPQLSSFSLQPCRDVVSVERFHSNRPFISAHCLVFVFSFVPSCAQVPLIAGAAVHDKPVVGLARAVHQGSLWRSGIILWALSRRLVAE